MNISKLILSLEKGDQISINHNQYFVIELDRIRKDDKTNAFVLNNEYIVYNNYIYDIKDLDGALFTILNRIVNNDCSIQKEEIKAITIF